jgi:hypothetical protein
VLQMLLDLKRQHVSVVQLAVTAPVRLESVPALDVPNRKSTLSPAPTRPLANAVETIRTAPVWPGSVLALDVPNRS